MRRRVTNLVIASIAVVAFLSCAGVAAIAILAPDPTPTIAATAVLAAEASTRAAPTAAPTFTTEPMSTPEPSATVTAPPTTTAPPQATAKSTVEPTATAAPPTAYTVQSGDSLRAIATKLGVTAVALAAYNQIADPGAVQVGQVLQIPPVGYIPPTPTATPQAVPSDTPVPALAATGTTAPSPPAATETPAAVAGAVNVVISQYGGGQKPEFIAITNRGSTDVTMTGWRLESVERGDEEQTYTFPDGYVIAAGTTIKVYSGEGAPSSPADGLLWVTQNMWRNEGDEARLYDSTGQMVSSKGSRE
ncbi:MAG: lamin tail domain-containing protein [Anaerolineae bacterium]